MFKFKLNDSQLARLHDNDHVIVTGKRDNGFYAAVKNITLDLELPNGLPADVQVGDRLNVSGNLLVKAAVINCGKAPVKSNPGNLESTVGKL